MWLVSGRAGLPPRFLELGSQASLFQVTSVLWETQGQLWFCLFQQNQIYFLHLSPP